MDFYEVELERAFINEFKKWLKPSFDLFGFLFPGIQEDDHGYSTEKGRDTDANEDGHGILTLPATQHHFQRHDLSGDDHHQRDRLPSLIVVLSLVRLHVRLVPS